MFCFAEKGYVYRMDNGVLSDGTAMDYQVTLSDIAFIPKQRGKFVATQIDHINLYTKEQSTEEVNIYHYGDTNSTPTTLQTLTLSHTGYLYKELRASVSNTLSKAHVLHKVGIDCNSISGGTVAPFEPLVMNIVYREGSQRSEEPV